METVPFGYKMHNGVAVPDYEVARSVPVEVMLDKLGVLDRLYEVNGKNGKELQGWCPFGGEHGKKGSFSINKTSGKFMCHACKRSGSHVLRLVELYMETHTDDARFDGTGTQAAARWLVSLIESGNEEKEEKQQSETESATALLSDFDKGLWCSFMGVMRPQLTALLGYAQSPVNVAGLLSDAVHEIARELEKQT